MAFDPDKYLAEKEQSGGFDPDAYLASKGVSGDEDPGAMKSFGAGVMSGVPGAETAIAGVKSALGDKSYEEEHQALEDLKNKAWDKHGTAYGTGKGAGIVGTSLLAPESVPARLAMATGMGAASGIDAAKSLSEAPLSAVKGAGVGLALGGVGEGLGKLITKGVPAAAKGLTNSLAGGAENVDTYLANPSGVEAALGKTAAAEKLADRANDLSIASGHLSDDAVSKLRPDVSPIMAPKPTGALSSLTGGVSEDTLAPLFSNTEKALTVSGVPVGQAQTNAFRAIQGYKDSLTKIAEANGGQIPETALGKIVRDLQSDINWKTDDAVVNGAKKEFEGTLNALLKKSNPEYAAAMEPVAEATGMVGDVKRGFGLKNGENGLESSDLTNTKMGTVINDDKSNAQELISKFGDLTGFDFLKNADLGRVKDALTEGGNSNQLLNVLGHTGGFVGGKMTGIPGGGLVGSLIGGTAAHAADGGKIAKSFMDAYLSGSQKIANSATAQAVKKYGPMLVAAAKQGGNQLAATHFVLATSHPEYSAAISDMQQNPQ